MSKAGSPPAVLVIGATSDIARHTADRLAAAGHALWLGGRDHEELTRIAADLRVRHGVAVDTLAFDADAFADAPDAAAAGWADALQGDVAGVVIALGVYAKEVDVRERPGLAERMDLVNHRVPAALLKAVPMRVVPGGFVCLVSSVAGDRVRPSLASYAESKRRVNEAFETARAASPGLRWVLVKPGPTDTKATWGSGAPMMADPADVGRDIATAIAAGRRVVYTPAKWRLVMAIIRLIPGPIFRKLFANR